MIKSTKCLICGVLIQANGSIRMRMEAQHHLSITHPEHFDEFVAKNREYEMAQMKAFQELKAEASKLLADPEYLLRRMV